MEKYRWLILAAVCVTGCLLLWLMQKCNLYLHIGPINSYRTGGALVFLCMLFLCTWANSAILKKNTWNGVVFVCLLAVECVALLFLVGCLLWSDCESRYFTFCSPDGEYAVVAEEEAFLFSGHTYFYEEICPGLMRKTGNQASTDDGARPFSYGLYELKWETNQLTIYYNNCSGSEGLRSVEEILCYVGSEAMMYNIGSLVIGLAAWAIPLLAIGKKYRFALCCVGSLSCCVVSLLLQLLEVKRRVNLSDWSALMDTIDAVALAAVVMIGGMLVMNFIALCGFRKRGA